MYETLRRMHKWTVENMKSLVIEEIEDENGLKNVEMINDIDENAVKKIRLNIN